MRIALSDVHRHRLFAQHVLACFGCGNRLLRMEMDRRRHVHALDSRVGQQLPPVGIPPPHTERGRKRLRKFRASAADRNQLAGGRIAQGWRSRLRAISPAPIRPHFIILRTVSPAASAFPAELWGIRSSLGWFSTAP